MTDDIDISEDSAYFKRSLFGRKRGRRLTGIRDDAINNVLPALQIAPEDLPEDGSIAVHSYFAKSFTRHILEIGFGQGERLAAQMRKEPDTAFLAAEPFVNGMAAFLEEITPLPHDNIRVLMEDGMRIARSLAPQSVDEIYVLNPDPWHKVRHHKRRIISQKNLNEFHRILKPKGRLILTTDVPDLTDWMITQTVLHGGFAWQAKCANDWATPPQDWIATRYEQKGAKGAKKMAYLFFNKN